MPGVVLQGAGTPGVHACEREGENGQIQPAPGAKEDADTRRTVCSPLRSPPCTPSFNVHILKSAKKFQDPNDHLTGMKVEPFLFIIICFYFIFYLFLFIYYFFPSNFTQVCHEAHNVRHIACRHPHRESFLVNAPSPSPSFDSLPPPIPALLPSHSPPWASCGCSCSASWRAAVPRASPATSQCRPPSG